MKKNTLNLAIVFIVSSFAFTVYSQSKEMIEKTVEKGCFYQGKLYPPKAIINQVENNIVIECKEYPNSFFNQSSYSWEIIRIFGPKKNI